MHGSVYYNYQSQDGRRLIAEVGNTEKALYSDASTLNIAGGWEIGINISTRPKRFYVPAGHFMSWGVSHASFSGILNDI